MLRSPGSTLVLLALAFITAAPAAAQTPAATVTDSDDNVVLNTFVDGGLLVPGAFGTGTIPASGAGTRMMWYPKKAAFRAGQVDGNQWNDGNVGERSIAFGENTTASGTNATALGLGTTASNGVSTAMGFQTTASGFFSTSMGQGTVAATSASLSIGRYNDLNREASDKIYFVVGNGDPGDRSDALWLKNDGHLTTAGRIESKNGGFKLPDGTVVNDGGDLEGLPTNSKGSYDFSNEDGLVASGDFSTGEIPAVGGGARMMWYPAKAAFRAGEASIDEWNDDQIGERSTAFGLATTASGDESTAMGNNTTASGQSSTAMGELATASGDYSLAMGVGVTAASTRSLSVGSYNSANTNADNTLFVAGNGSLGNRSDALVLYKDGGLLVPGAFGSGTIPTTGAGTRMMWYPRRAAFRAGSVDSDQWNDPYVGDYSAAFGRNTKAPRSASTAMGDHTTASGQASTAMGDHTTAARDASLSIGKWNDLNRMVSDKVLFVVGNGSSGSRSDALVLDEDGNLTVNNLTETSDRRLKEQIQPLGDEILGKLGQLRPVRFRFKDERTHPSGAQLGLIAQDVRKQFPELVSTGSGGTLSVSYSKFTAVLLKGLQEQQATIDRLRNRLRQLETLKRRIARLEAQLSSGEVRTDSQTPDPDAPE